MRDSQDLGMDTMQKKCKERLFVRHASQQPGVHQVQSRL